MPQYYGTGLKHIASTGKSAGIWVDCRPFKTGICGVQGLHVRSIDLYEARIFHELSTGEKLTNNKTVPIEVVYNYFHRPEDDKNVVKALLLETQENEKLRLLPRKNILNDRGILLKLLMESANITEAVKKIFPDRSQPWTSELRRAMKALTIPEPNHWHKKKIYNQQRLITDYKNNPSRVSNLVKAGIHEQDITSHVVYEALLISLFNYQGVDGRKTTDGWNPDKSVPVEVKTAHISQKKFSTGGETLTSNKVEAFRFCEFLMAIYDKGKIVKIYQVQPSAMNSLMDRWEQKIQRAEYNGRKAYSDSFSETYISEIASAIYSISRDGKLVLEYSK